MKWVLLLPALYLSGCTVTISPIQKPHDHVNLRDTRHRSKSKVIKKTTDDSALVDQGWIDKYRMLEYKYEYWGADDLKIRSANGMARVPKTVVNHKQDLEKAEERKNAEHQIQRSP